MVQKPKQKKKPKKLQGEEFDLKKEREFVKRQARKESRPKKMVTVVEDEIKKKKKMKRKAGFTEDLTTIKKAKRGPGESQEKVLKAKGTTEAYRQKKLAKSGKPSHGSFKSKGKYKRRK